MSNKSFILEGAHYDMRGCIISVGDTILGINTTCLGYSISKVIKLCEVRGMVVTKEGLYDYEDCLVLPDDYINNIGNPT